ncbi:MAG TPA: MalY/PatB family protein [Thermoclostridium caenicola]|uniref:MalY/PatB family protein n=1 Tax=Thermoclostridium caenicola TaxID=659425 RepID=UPI002CBA9C3B|nr:MalY/PatB family protein [Thermoclostridium caenicola]HOK42364.1 MalY/PatB family protein [Thermoclostridium caenicola]HOL85056.1 MalY/PatB family protein [Thermoclostridium caenicola]HPO77167.1 MalY/PatB family protein [Thermoclostridium caenicola]
MQETFDTIIDRKNTDSIKYDFAVRRGLPEDVLPLWVADMDFRTPPCVIEALVEKSRHGIFGYSDTREDYFEVLHDWFSRQFGWQIRPEWLVKTPGVVYAICAAIRSLTNEGDAVLIQEPVYYPFSGSIRANGRKLVINQLVYSEGKYNIDFDDFEEKIIRNKVKLFILCSPHNPVGRVWTKEELLKLGDICLKHGVIVVADEIHADFTYPGHRHQVFVNLKPEFSDITITCTAPTKTFNLAGLQISNIFIANQAIRRKFKQEIVRSGYSQPNIMGIVACRAAYKDGGPWLEELKQYLKGNLDYLREFLEQRLPRIKLVEPEGTYLVWLDCSALGLDDNALEDFIVNKARLWLDSGTMFGAGGEGFQRINIACPRAILEQALTRLESAVNRL